MQADHYKAAFNVREFCRFTSLGRTKVYQLIRDGEIDVGGFQRADRHRDCGLFADGAEIGESAGLDPEHRALGVVGVGDEAAPKHLG